MFSGGKVTKDRLAGSLLALPADIFVTAVYAVAAIYQMRAMSDSLEQQKEALAQSRETFQQGQRPYIWLTDDPGKPACIKDANTSVPAGCYIAWNWRFTNYGQSPAHSVQFTHSMIIGNNVLGQPRILPPAMPTAPLPPNKVDFSSALWPERVTIEQYNELMNNDQSILVSGKINYSDARGGSYETGFCFYYLKSGAAAYCPTGNYIK